MGYFIGQAVGLLSTVCCLIMPLLKTKHAMLWFNGLINALVIVNIVLLDGFGSAALVCAVAVVQAIIMLGHLRNNTQVSKKENIVFLILYVVCGLIGFRRPLDGLATVGAVFNMLATFQRDEQRTRWLMLMNALSFAVYYSMIGSTVLFSVLCTITSTVIGLIRYRKKK